MINLRIYREGNKIRRILAEQWLLLPVDFVSEIYWEIHRDQNLISNFSDLCQYIESNLNSRISREECELDYNIIEGETCITDFSFEWTFKRVSKRKILDYFGYDSLVTNSLPQNYENMFKKFRLEYCLSLNIIDIQKMYERSGLWMEIILLITYTIKDNMRLSTKNSL